MPPDEQGFTLNPDEHSRLEAAIAQADRGELIDGWKLLAEPGGPTTMDTVLKRFEEPDEIREFDKGRFEIVHIGGLTIGRATYQPGWKWSVHVGPGVGAEYCEVEHVGLVVSGHAVAAFADGTIVDLTPGALFHVPPKPHDSWVVGDEPYVSLHFLGADHYATPHPDGIFPAVSADSPGLGGRGVDLSPGELKARASNGSSRPPTPAPRGPLAGARCRR